MLLQSLGNVWRGHGSASPAALFVLGEAGVIVDFSDIRTLFKEQTGVTPVTLPGDAIGLASDRSRRRSPITNHAALQASTGLRPVYARAPVGGRRNMVPNNTTAGAVVGVIGSGGALPAGWSAPATLAQEIVALGTDGGVPYFDLRLTGTLTGGYFINCNSQPGVAAANLQTWVCSVHAARLGASTGVDALTFIPSSRLSGGTLKHVYPSIAVGFPATLTRFATPATTLLSADGAVGDVAFILGYLRLSCTGGVDITMRIGGAQLEIAAASTPLQLVTSSTNVTEAGKPTSGAARFDLVDDKLTITLPAALTGDLMIFGRTGSWIEANVTIPSGPFDLGPTGTVQTAQVLRALGDIVGAVLIGRVTTATERDAVLAYFRARGAAGWLIAGTNLWPASGYTDDTGGITVAGSVYTGTGGTGLLGLSGGGLVPGATYIADATVLTITAGSFVLPWDGNAGNTLFVTAPGTYRHVFIAKGPGAFIYSAGFVGTVTNVSLRRLTT